LDLDYGLDRLLLIPAALLFDLPVIAAAPTHLTAGFVAPLAGIAGAAGMLFAVLPIIFRSVYFSGQTGHSDPSHDILSKLIC
jgi:hypothetical protein